jgi:hypothetical protein
MEEWDPAVNDFVLRCNSCWRTSKLVKIIRTSREKYYCEALHKAWLAYVIAKNKDEFDKQIHYASIILKLQKELNLEVSCFPQLGLYAIEDEVDDTGKNNVPLHNFKHLNYDPS